MPWSRSLVPVGRRSLTVVSTTLAAIQMAMTDSVDDNVATAERLVRDAAGQGAGSIDAALALARGEEVDRKVYIPFQLVTPENMSDFTTQN
mgnify:CR=1 FL=1